MENIREQFPILKRSIQNHPLVYLDSAASTLKPQSVIDAISNHYSYETANIHRGVHFLSEEGTRKFEETRMVLKNFINAKHTHEVLFTKGTTESINLVAECYGRTFLGPGDQILLSTMEHHSNIVPWQLIAQKVGAQVVEIPINDQGEIDQVTYEKLLSPKVKMVAIAHISNSLGTINPIREMIQKAHSVGAKFLVDGAQAIAHEKVDVQALNADFYAFSGHKMFGPTGIGVLYAKEELLNEMPPYQGGGDMIDEVTFAQTTFNDLPHKFEAGTPHIAGGISLKAAVEFIQSLSFNQIQNYEKELLNYATEQVKNIKGLKIIGQAQEKCSVLAFSIDNVHPHDLGTLLDKQGIAVRTGHHCTQPLMKRFGITGTTRVSFSIYNNREDVDRFIAGLQKSLELL